MFCFSRALWQLTARGMSTCESTVTVVVVSQAFHISFHCAMQLANARLEAQPITITTAFDMWQLGTFVYEVATGSPYWPANTTDLQILHTLASDSQKLPHEERPVQAELVRRILAQLLTRSAEARLTAESLKKLLDKEEETGTLAATINAGHAKTEMPIVLDT